MHQRLLNLLYDNAQYTADDLATMTGMTVDEVKKVIESYEKEGIICGYKTLLNWERINSSYLTALIELKVTPQKDAGFDQIAEKILAFDEVESLYLMSGGFDFTVIVRGESFQQVAKFVGSCLAPMENVISTATHFVLRRYKEMNVRLTPEQHDDRRPMSF